MAKVQTVPACLEHAAALAPRLRAEDVAEVLASHGHGPLEALTAALAASELAGALLVDGEVAALYGVAPVRETILGPPVAGSIWLLGSDALGRHRREFLRRSRLVVAEALERYPLLFNFVDARYTAALRWAAWLGFEVLPAQPHGVAGLPFHRIVMRKGG